MKAHSFLLEEGNWTGEGKIALNMVAEELDFVTNWSIQKIDIAGKIRCIQEIQIHGLSENMRNELIFFDFGKEKFCIEMENTNIGKVLGTGILDEKLIAWEFRENDLQFEGLETYTKQEDGSYRMKGEYMSTDQLRTQIEGKIWKI